MAEKVKFRRGLSTALPSDKVAGTFLVETDTGTMYVDDSTTKRVQIKDNTKLPIDGTAKKAESDSNGNSLTDRITTLDTNESTGVVTLKNEKGETKGTVVNSSYVDTALSDKLNKINLTGTGSFSLNRQADTTIGDYSFAEGFDTTASGYASHAEGGGTTASSYYSHAEGSSTTASGNHSHAEGSGTKASSHSQHTQGQYNIEDSAGTYADIIGNGNSAARSNAATVDWSGNAWYAGDVYVGSTSGTNKDSGSKKLATEEYVQSRISSGGVTVDVAMSDTSVHPVQNKVIKTYVDSLVIDDGSID